MAQNSLYVKFTRVQGIFREKVSAFHMADYEKSDVLNKVRFGLFEYALLEYGQERLYKVSVGRTFLGLKLVKIFESIPKIIEKTFQKQVYFDFFFGIKPKGSLFNKLLLSLHFKVWILRWKSGAFTSANFHFSIQHRNLVDYLGQKPLFEFKYLFQWLLSLVLLFEYTADTRSTDCNVTLRLRLKIFSGLSQKLFAD